MELLWKTILNSDDERLTANVIDIDDKGFSVLHFQDSSLQVALSWFLGIETTIQLRVGVKQITLSI